MLLECAGPILLVLGKTRRICIPPSAILCVEICFVVQFSGQNHGVNACTIPFTRTKLTLKPLYYGVLIQGGTPTRPSFPRCSEVWKCVMSLLYCIVKEALARGAPAQKVARGPSQATCTGKPWPNSHPRVSSIYASTRVRTGPPTFFGVHCMLERASFTPLKGCALGRRNILESHSRSKISEAPVIAWSRSAFCF